ncbi:VIT-domain-containing protein [Hypoxylon sp. FL1857]|nr:VIT-domain-containing protein [Hypoxylon sp. FL1857]
MTVFAAGIVWDSREPLPPEFQHLGGLNHSVSYHAHVPVHTMQLASFVPGDKLPSGTSRKEFPDNVIREPTRNVLPPLSISINGRIVGDTAKVSVSQVFWNNADVPIPQASYVFPLPNGCTITSFSCRVGRNKVLKAKVKPKEEAREAFQNAVAMHHTAALLEQNTPEIFTASLGNIPANTRLEAELTYVTLLKRQFLQDKNITTFSIPTAIANRYGHAPADIAGMVPGKAPHTFTLQLEVMEAEKIVQIKSETHKILLDHGPQKGKASSWNDLSRQGSGSNTDVAVVKLDPDAGFLQQDFTLTIETSSPSNGDQVHAWIESHPSLKNQKAVMITIPSSFMENKGTPPTGEVIFLVDRSGSMDDKIDAVKSSLRFFLKGIPVGRKFNIWSFGSSFERLWPTSRVYSSESLQIALDHVERQFKANMGGTELLPALDAMLQSRDTSCPCDVIILTDGEVWRLDETLSLVQNTRLISQGDVRFFSLGIGAHVSHALVQGIASRGSGYSEVIPKASLGGWEDRLVSMLKAALTSHIDTVRIRVNGSEGCDQYLTSPAEIRYLNPFQGNRIYLLSKPDISLDQVRDITIETTRPNGDEDATAVTITMLQNPDTTIHSLAARAILDDAEHPTNVIPLPNKDRRPLDQAQAEALGCRFSLVSKWTSFFLQEEKHEPGEDDQPIPSISAQDTTHGLVLLQRPGTRRFATKYSHGIGSIDRMSLSTATSCTYDPTIEDAYDAVPGPSDRMRRLHDYDIIESRNAMAVAQPQIFKLSRRRSGNANILFPSPRASKRMGPVESGKLLMQKFVKKARSLRRAKSSSPQASSGEGEANQNDNEQSQPASNPDDATLGKHKKFVADLLTYQNFDGSIRVDASSILGPSLASVAQEIEAHISKSNIGSGASAALLAYTLVAVVLLERDLLDCKDLWDLMKMKAVDYIATQVPEESKKAELMKFAEERLAGKELTLSDATSPYVSLLTDGTGDPNDRLERTVVQVAPIE